MMLTGIVIEQADGPDRATFTGLRGCRFYPVPRAKGCRPCQTTALPTLFFPRLFSPARCPGRLSRSFVAAAPNRGGSAGQTMEALAPGARPHAPSPRRMARLRRDDPSSPAAPPASPSRRNAGRFPRLDCYGGFDTSTRTATGTSADLIAHDTSSEDDRDDPRPVVDDLDGLANHRVLHIHGTPVGICEVHLLGTAHVSWDSARDAVRLVRSVRPDVVFLELCEARRRVIQPRPTDVPTDEPQSVADGGDVEARYAGVGDRPRVDAGRDGQGAGRTPGCGVRGCRRRGVGGGRMRGRPRDRDVGTTLRRTWHAMSAWERVRFVWAMIAGDSTCQTATSCGD